jgi:mannosyltransferase
MTYAGGARTQGEAITRPRPAESTHLESPPQPAPSRARPTRNVAAAIVVLTGLAAAVRFVGIGHQSYWYDEAHTVFLMHFSLGGMIGRLPGSETTPPLYFLVAWLWAHSVGSGEAGLRSLSALCGVLTVPLAYAVGKELFSRRVGLTCAALAACNPLLVWYSQEARSYALLVLLSAAGLLAFAHLRRGPNRRWAIVWTIASVLALATHYYAALTIVPQWVCLLRWQRHARVSRIGLGVVAAWLAILGLLAIRQLHFLGTGGSWITYIPLLPRIADVPKTFAVGPNTLATAVLGSISVLTVAASILLCMTRTRSAERRTARFVLLLTASGFGIVVALVVFGFDQLYYRNMLALWLPVALLVASGLGAERAGWIGTAGAAALCAVGLTAVAAVAAEPRLQRPDWRAVARAIGPGPTRAVLIVNGCESLPLSLYLSGLRSIPTGGATVNEVDVIRASHQSSWYVVLSSGWYVVCRPSEAHPAPLPSRLGGFRAAGSPMRVNQFSIQRLRSARPLHLTPQTFARARLQGELMVQPAADASRGGPGPRP